MILTELFPIQTENVPSLYSYRLETAGQPELNEIGGGLSWPLAEQRPDDETWAWSKTRKRLYANVNRSAEELKPIVKHCRQSGQDRFQPLMNIVPDGPADADPQAVADFVAWGRWHDVKYDIYDALNAEGFNVSPVYVRRKCGRKPRVVDGHPALQVYVSSEITHHDTLRQIWADDPDLDLRGLGVKDNTKDRNALKGTVQQQTGRVGDHRDRLLDYVSADRMVEVIQNANADTPVVSVEKFRGNGKTYEYVLDALDVIVHPRHYEKLGIPRSVQNKLTLSPSERAVLLQKAVAPLKNEDLIGTALNNRDAPSQFGESDSVDYVPSIRLGDGTTIETENISVQSIQRHGVVSGINAALDSTTLALVKAGSPPSSEGFGGEVQQKLDDLGGLRQLCCVKPTVA
jgi:hypothetical protein